MKKGIILEVDERFLTLLTPDGEFLKARKQNKNYLLGEEIDFFPVSNGLKKKTVFFNIGAGKALAAAVFALAIGVSSFIPLYGNNDVYAYMSIDVNPSIELAVNKDLEVVDLDGYNTEGKQIISHLKDWKHEEVSVVATKILNEIKNQGFFENHDKVLISTVYEDKKGPKVKEKLETNIEQIETKIEKDHLSLSVVHGTTKEREIAHKQGLTTGVYKENQVKVKKKTIKQEQKLETTKKELKDDKVKNNHPDDHHKDKSTKIEKELKKEEIHGKHNNGKKLDNDKSEPPGQQKKKNKEDISKKNNKNKWKGKVKEVIKTSSSFLVDHKEEKEKEKEKAKKDKEKKEKEKNKDDNGHHKQEDNEDSNNGQDHQTGNGNNNKDKSEDKNNYKH